MRKKITIFLMMLIASFMLITSTNEVYAFEYDPDMDYEDLFYEKHIVEIEVMSDDTLNMFGSIEPDGAFNKLKALYDDGLLSDGLIASNVDVYYNDTLVQDNIYFSFGQTGGSLSIISISFINYSTPKDYIQIGKSYGNNGKHSILGTYDFPIGTKIRVEVTEHLTWTQAYDYGRLKKLDDYENDPIFNYDSQNEKVFIGFTGQYLISPYPSKVKYGPALWQSPYKNFKIVGSTPNQDVIKDIKNVAAVYYDVTGDGEYLDNELTIYYWEDNIILKEEVIVPYYGQAYFYGGIREAISGEETMVANVDNLVPLTDFLQYIEAWDDLDGDISDQVFIEDDGNYKNDVVGVYTVTFGVTDSENNTSYLEVDIHVVDIVAPTITGTATDIQISYTDEFSVASWVNSLQVTDNYYTSNLDITVKTNTYSANKTTPGNYYVEVKVTDGSGNVGTLIRNITVVDDKGPEFQGLNTITTSISENLTINDIKSGLAAIDAIDGNVTNSITVDSDQLTGNNTQPGTYEVIFKAVDSQGNASFHTVTVTIVSQPPKFYIIDGSSIRLLPGANLTIEQILALLGVTDPINLTSNYNAEVPGTYQLSFTVGNEDYNLNIIVLGANQPGIPPALVGDNNFKIDWKIVGWVVLGLVAVVGVAYILKKKK